MVVRLLNRSIYCYNLEFNLNPMVIGLDCLGKNISSFLQCAIMHIQTWGADIVFDLTEVRLALTDVKVITREEVI